ncbi:MAG: enoyl-CoA hydratase/isomerase family protein [Gammaproteobacteria bacterium]|nr:enoyl-CoA hydratase/isomerase family protein [Gammaproteobacteria bacterium]
MAYQHFEFDVSDGVGTITLNRPGASNSLTLELVDEFLEIAIACDSDPAVRAILLTANGSMFCAGADLKLFASSGDQLGAVVRTMLHGLHSLISRLARMDVPVVTAVNGTAAGGGFSLAIMGDYVIAAESANFVMAYTASGLSPDASSTYYLPRLIGVRRARQLMLTNKRLGAAQALEWGLIDEVAPDAELRSTAYAMAARLAKGPTAAFGSTKRLLLSTFDNGLETQMELEGAEVTQNALGRDAQEGIRAFVEKRPPQFTGRR